MPNWSRAIWMAILAIFLAALAVSCVGGMYYVLDEIHDRMRDRDPAGLGLLSLGLTNLGFALVAFGCILSLGRMLRAPRTEGRVKGDVNEPGHERLLRRAIEVAAEASRDGRCGPFGAVVARGDEILGEGHNRVVAARDPTSHAEVMAIRNACAREGTHVLEGCVIYCSCEPCPMCLSAIYWARIRHVVFAATREDAVNAGFDDGVIQAEVGLDWPDRSVTFVREMTDAGRDVLRRWAENPDRRAY